VQRPQTSEVKLEAMPAGISKTFENEETKTSNATEKAKK
jgi:hypothetical protein